MEPTNPFDSLALRVETRRGEVIGYIPKSSWLRAAIHEEGRGCASTIASIAAGGAGLLGVVIDVTLCDDDLPLREYQQTEPRSSGGFWSGLKRGLSGQR
jgi:hypothetical protein